ncbi:hypothetical protein CR513_19949, partial [Mucuna pruriens]
MFQKVEINIPLLDTIKQVPKYAKFLKELCVHKRRKIKGTREIGGVVSALTKNEELTIALPRKCRDLGIFSVPCTIGNCTFADAMLDLGASINVMPASIYRSLNFGDLEPTWMIVQLANRSIVQPLGVLEDVHVQVNELIFPIDFYVVDMEDETSGKESTLILGRPFLMTARTKIVVNVGTLSMEFGDTLVQFNIFEAMNHPTEDHSLFNIDVSNSSGDMEAFARSTDENSCLGVVDEETNPKEVQDIPNSEDNHSDIPDLDFEVELSELLDQINPPSGSDSEAAQEVKADSNPTRTEAAESSRAKQSKAEIMSAHLMPSRYQVDSIDPNLLTEKSPSPPPMELKPLSSNLKYAYLDKE